MKKIRIPGATETLLMDADKIICLEGDRGYTHIYLVDEKAKEGWRKITVSYGLTYFEELLTCLLFARVCKSYIVGLQYICGIGHDHTVNLQYKCCDSIALSSKFCSDLMPVLKRSALSEFFLLAFV